jgi:hypothetical protein
MSGSLRCCGLAAAWAALGLAAAAPASAGTFTALSYNVAGLPAAFGGEGEANNVLVSPRLNGYDLVAVQEDFFFHDDLVHAIDYPYVSEKDSSGPAGSGDGLLRMTQLPFTDFQRETWVACFGTTTNASDCLTPKGFTAARHELAPGVFLDVVNLHAEAGNDPEDLEARRAGLRQLVDFLQVRSPDDALLLLGDWNSRYTRAGDILPEILADLALRDPWLDLQRGGVPPLLGPSLDDCASDPAAAGCERVDKFFYRGSDTLELTALAYEVPRDAFLDDAGVPLSDHDPVAVTFAYRVIPEPSLLALGAAALLGASARRARAGTLRVGSTVASFPEA